MKTFKLALFSLAFTLLMFTSCTNDEPVVMEDQSTEESESIITTFNRLNQQVDQNGNFNVENNPAGNIVFDFCFDFVYPLTLSFNNGTTVTVENLDGLVDVMINSTEDLYVNGIAFPFDVETYNETTNAIDIETINNEEEFATLLESCLFDDFEPCDCFEVYEPVCVQVTDPNGETFTITYSNSCYAECDGFTEADFVDDCEEDYFSFDFECFTLNYPLEIIIDDETTVTVNSNEELGNAIYDVYNFDFVYPFSVTLENEEVVTINSAEDIEALIETCFGDLGNSGECEECLNLPFDPVCVEVEGPTGETAIFVFSNACVAECEGYTENDFVNCEDNTPVECTSDSVEAIALECPWIAIYASGTFGYSFNSDGTFTVSDGSGNTITTGTWSVVQGNTGAQTIILDAVSGNFDDEWAFLDCNWDTLSVQSLIDQSAAIGSLCD
ncbi:hypothetical protein [Winogradskyella sp. PE311]|uniref:hypothetical protein n=1 Tax=Winogradskyella sp. PE311 TaxID=3366943 RepID=UPI0039800B3B